MCHPSTSIFMPSDTTFYVYSKRNCGFCEKLTQFMDEKGINYEKFTLGSDFDKKQFIQKFGSNKTFPQVHCESTHIGGMKDTVRYLIQNNFV